MIGAFREKLLFDTSSLIRVLKLKRVDVLYGNCIQWLTVYEMLNAIWKEVYLVKSLSLVEAKKLLEIFMDVLNFLKILSVHPYEAEVLEVAVDLGLTAYDASYIVLARKNGLVLVTEDRKLREKAEKLVKVMSVGELIRIAQL